MKIILECQNQDEVLSLLRQIKRQGEKIMAKVDELLAELAEANTTTNEIAADVDELLSKLVAGGLTPEETEQVKTEIAALRSRLTGVAAKYPVTP